MSQSLTIPNTLAQSQQARIWLKAMLHGDFAEDFTPKERNRILLSLDEAITNIVDHSRQATFIEITLERQNDAIIISIVDDGEAFDPLGYPAPAMEEHLQGKDNGLGIYIILQIMEAEYRRKDNKNHLILKKKYHETH
jgi:anti-sigma regulatory factor (Ser/Thr protein kinase)